MKKWTFLTTLLALVILAAVPAPTYAATPKIVDFNPGVVYKSDGTVWQFGYKNNMSIPTRIELPKPAKKMVGSVVLFEDGTVWRYPYVYESSTPGPISQLSGITDLAGKGNHFLALKSDGTVWSWGSNGQGELGIGKTEGVFTTIPQQVAGLTDITAIAAGDVSLALNAKGEVYTWGGYSHLTRVTPDNPQGYRLTPLRIYGLPAITAIDMHYTSALALSKEGKVFTWGNNFLRLPSTYGNENTLHAPALIEGMDNVKAIAMGYKALFLKTDGSVYAAGLDLEGYRLTEAQVEQQLRPHPMTSLHNIKKIDATGGQLYALDANGELYGWGNSSFGQLGEGSNSWNTRITTPTKILDTGTVIINGVRQDYPGVIHQGVTMVPLRKLAEPLGATLGFEDQTKRVTISYGGQKVSMLPGDATVTVNGAPLQLGGPIRIYNNETHVPLRFISELFGAQVAWHADRAEITVTTAK